MKKAVIFDIDGVLARISKNEDGTPKRGYRDYDKVDLDEPIKEVFGFIEYYLADGCNKIIFITGRKQLCTDKTKKWILKRFNKISDIMKSDDFDDHFKLFMRPDNDHRPAVKLKKEIYETKIKGNYDVVIAFDDDPEVCKMYKEQGILTLQVLR